MTDKWLDDIRKSQADLRLDAPENLWDGIEAGLSAPELSAGATRSGRVSVSRKVLPWAVAGLSSAVAAALALFLLLPGRGEMPAHVQEGIALLPRDGAVAVAELSSSSDSGIPSPPTVLPSAVWDDAGNSFDAPVECETENSEQQSVEAAVDRLSSQETVPSSPVESEESSMKPSSVQKESFGGDAPFDAPEEKPRYREKKLKLGLAISNVSGNSGSSKEYAALYGSPVTRQIHSFSETSGEFPDSYGYVSVLQGNEGGEVSSSVKNFQPIQVGVTLAYSFTDRLSLESGLTYSCLLSALSSGSDMANYRIRQSLHYLGIPLNLKYDFLKIKDFSMYSSVGGQMEKCFSGKTVTDYFSSGTKISSERGSIMVEPLQWSVNAHVGAQYSLAGWAGIYLEAGAAYYFRNGSPVNCIYSERPLNFSLRAGVRFSL